MYPLLVKTVVRGQAPAQHAGGLCRAIPKSASLAHSTAGWRSILLLEPTNKAIQKAYPGRLMEELLKSCAPSQFGGFPEVSLDHPAVVVKAHFSNLVASGQNGGAVFVDRKAAYYAVIRDPPSQTCCTLFCPPISPHRSKPSCRKKVCWSDLCRPGRMILPSCLAQFRHTGSRPL